MTPMSMVKTQVYLPAEELRALHREARRQQRRVAELVREAVRQVWLRSDADGPVAIIPGPLSRCSAEHDSAFDRI